MRTSRFFFLYRPCSMLIASEICAAAPPGANTHAGMSLVDISENVPLPLHELPSPSLRPPWVPLVKTKFSMIVPQVEQQLKEWETKSVVLCGIEVRFCARVLLKSSASIADAPLLRAGTRLRTSDCSRPVGEGHRRPCPRRRRLECQRRRSRVGDQGEDGRFSLARSHRT